MSVFAAASTSLQQPLHPPQELYVLPVARGLEAEVAVVGAGVMGLATARALARGGHDVVLLEQFRFGHARGSSHGSSRVFRLAYYEPEWVRFAREALSLWRELEVETGGRLLELPGSLDLGGDAEALGACLDECGAAHEVLDAAEVERRFGLSAESGPAVLQPDGGVVYAERALEALLASARVHGARLVEETKAVALEQDGEAVRVLTAGGVVIARAAVVTAGAWARELLATAGVELPVAATRETVAYFRLGVDGVVPSVIDWATPDPGEWGLPRSGSQLYALHAGPGLLKGGLNQSGRETDPDEEGEPDPTVVRCVADWAARVFPLEHNEPLSAEACLYTSTADESFVLERHGRLVVGSPCSGHGFKFAPAVGARLAALAVDALAEA